MIGKTLTRISQECKKEAKLLTATIVRKHMQYSAVPGNESWRMSVISELAEKTLDFPGFSESEIQDMLTCACIA